MTPMERYNVLLETSKGATVLINTILDEYGAVDLLNSFFPNMDEREQQRLIDLCHYRMFAEEASKVKISDEYMYNGQKKPLRDLCAEKKLPEAAVVKRLKRGWSITAALETPIKHCRIQVGTCGY